MSSSRGSQKGRQLVTARRQETWTVHTWVRTQRIQLGREGHQACGPWATHRDVGHQLQSYEAVGVPRLYVQVSCLLAVTNCRPFCTYIGQTGRSLDHRLREHRRALKNGDVGSSALAEHVFSANHQVDLSKAMVIDTHNHTKTRCMLESWHIQHHQSPLNREKGTLPGLYAALLS